MSLRHIENEVYRPQRSVTDHPFQEFAPSAQTGRLVSEAAERSGDGGDGLRRIVFFENIVWLRPLADLVFLEIEGNADAHGRRLLGAGLRRAFKPVFGRFDMRHRSLTRILKTLALRNSSGVRTAVRSARCDGPLIALEDMALEIANHRATLLIGQQVIGLDRHFAAAPGG